MTLKEMVIFFQMVVDSCQINLHKLFKQVNNLSNCQQFAKFVLEAVRVYLY